MRWRATLFWLLLLCGVIVVWEVSVVTGKLGAALGSAAEVDATTHELSLVMPSPWISSLVAFGAGILVLIAVVAFGRRMPYDYPSVLIGSSLVGALCALDWWVTVHYPNLAVRAFATSTTEMWSLLGLITAFAVVALMLRALMTE